MCMKTKTPDIKQPAPAPAPAPVAQTDDLTQKKMSNGTPIGNVRKLVMIVPFWLVR